MRANSSKNDGLACKIKIFCKKFHIYLYMWDFFCIFAAKFVVRMYECDACVHTCENSNKQYEAIIIIQDMQRTNVNLDSTVGTSIGVSVENVPMLCPVCGVQIVPTFLQMSYSEKKGHTMFCRCTNTECESTFICKYVRRDPANGKTRYELLGIQHDMVLKKEEFSEDIETISPAFVEIYNQAYAAQQLELTDVCGVGYRKALEFLIKDYIIFEKTNEAEIEAIKSKKLGKCISEDVQDANVKEVAKRATWLGNDETHYVRKWEDKDIHSLVNLIRLVIHWIEASEATKRILAEMDAPK